MTTRRVNGRASRRPLTTALLLCWSLAPSLFVAPAQAQYRTGLPEVLAPAGQPTPAQVEQRFRDTYVLAGRPRVVLYWNRELDDELADRKNQRVDIRATGIETGPVSAGVVRIDSTESISNPVSAGGVPRHLAAVETSFVQQLARDGVRLVDRAAILRLEHARTRKSQGVAHEPTDTRANEMDALSGHADLLLEIVFVEAGRSADNVEFKLLAKDTRTGAMPFSLTTRARSSAVTDSDFVANNTGFVRKPRTLEEVGRQLAIDTMAAWNA